MQITVTITADALTPEVTQMLSGLGAALSRQKHETPDPADTKTVEPAAEPVKKARAPKTAKPVNITNVNDVIGDETVPDEETDDAPAPTLESLRKTIVDLAKGGKSAAVGKALKEVAPSNSKGRLQDVAKEDYATLAEKLAAI